MYQHKKVSKMQSKFFHAVFSNFLRKMNYEIQEAHTNLCV